MSLKYITLYLFDKALSKTYLKKVNIAVPLILNNSAQMTGHSHLWTVFKVNRVVSYSFELEIVNTSQYITEYILT